MLVGWSGTEKSLAAEDWKKVERKHVEATIKEFLNLINEAVRKGWSIWAIGD